MDAPFCISGKAGRSLLLCNICLSLLGMVWYYQKIDIPMTRFVEIGKFFLLLESKLSYMNKMLFSDCLDKLTVFFFYYCSR